MLRKCTSRAHIEEGEHYDACTQVTQDKRAPAFPSPLNPLWSAECQLQEMQRRISGRDGISAHHGGIGIGVVPLAPSCPLLLLLLLLYPMKSPVNAL